MPPGRRAHRPHVRVLLPKGVAATGGKFAGEGQTTAAGRDAIVQALAAGATVIDVAHQLRVSSQTVYYWKRRLATTGRVDVKSGRGRARTVRNRGSARSFKAILRKGCSTWNDVKGKLSAKGHHMSRTSVRRIALEHNAHSVSALTKPPLSDETRQKRLQYAQKHVKWPKEAWRRVVFIDESATAPLTSRRVIVLKGQQAPIIHVDKRAQKIHFFGYISASGHKSQLHILPPGQTWTGAKLAPLGRGLKKPGVKVVLDGASPHNQLKRDLVRSRAIVLAHPPYSPDLNPIENVWAKVKSLAARGNPKGPAELTKALKEAWDSVKPSEFRAYADSMPRRLQAVIESGGDHTKY